MFDFWSGLNHFSAFTMSTIIFILITTIVMASNYVAACVSAHVDSSERTPIENFLSAVSILDGTQNICSGVILNKRWIITSAHCLKKTDNLYVRYGSNNQNDISRISIGVDKIVIHRDFDPVSLVNNVALVRVSADIKFCARVEQAKLPTTNTEEDDTAYAIGWEKTTEKVGLTSSIKRFFSYLKIGSFNFSITLVRQTP